MRRIAWLSSQSSSFFSPSAPAEATTRRAGGDRRRQAKRPHRLRGGVADRGLPDDRPGAAYNFAGSDELATQIREGAPADVYAAASSKYPQELFDEGLVEEPVTFASNRLVLIVPKDNPAGIETVEDVTRPGTKLVIAAEGVPVGDYTREVLEELDLTDALDNVVSNEDDVKGVVGKVSLGEADAGFVYATDAPRPATTSRVIELPEARSRRSSTRSPSSRPARARRPRRHSWTRFSARTASKRSRTPASSSARAGGVVRMELSARNQLDATVKDVKLGTIMAEVTADVGGQDVVAAITRGSAERLDLKPGDEVVVIVKATEVMLARLGAVGPGQPRLRCVELVGLEHLELAGADPAERGDRVPHPVLVGDDGEPLPGRPVLEPDRAGRLDVLPHRAEVEAVEVGRRHDEVAHALAAVERLEDRVEQLVVLVPGHLPGDPEPHRPWRHVGEPLDHRLQASGRSAPARPRRRPRCAGRRRPRSSRATSAPCCGTASAGCRG